MNRETEPDTLLFLQGGRGLPAPKTRTTAIIIEHEEEEEEQEEVDEILEMEKWSPVATTTDNWFYELEQHYLTPAGGAESFVKTPDVLCSPKKTKY